jgi:hypothetical protein
VGVGSAGGVTDGLSEACGAVVGRAEGVVGFGRLLVLGSGADVGAGGGGVDGTGSCDATSLGAATGAGGGTGVECDAADSAAYRSSKPGATTPIDGISSGPATEGVVPVPVVPVPAGAES